MKPRLVVVVSHPIQYYAPLYRELAQRGRVDVHVVYLSDAGATAYHDKGFGRSITWDIPLLEGYAHTVLRPGLALEGQAFWAQAADSLDDTLTALAPDALLLYGYASRMNWQALRWANRNGCRVLYTSDSNVKSLQNRWRSFLKAPVVRYFFSRVDAFLCTGKANREYLKQFGARDGRIIRIPFAVDVDRFARNAASPEGGPEFQFVWAGKLISNKRPQDFIAALRQVAEGADEDIHAIMVGDGPMREELEAMAASLPDLCHLKFAGFVNQAAMPAALHASSVFVMSSETEPYGLAATEAAAAGLALIATDGAGCVGDTMLARPGKNALVYKAGDVRALAEHMRRLLSDGQLLAGMQASSRSIAREHDIPVAAEVIDQLVLRMCAGEPVVDSRTTPVMESGSKRGFALDSDCMAAPRKTRVAVVVSHPIQHFCPQYCSWAKQESVDLRVHFASTRGLESYHDASFGRAVKWRLKLDFDHVFLPGAESNHENPDIGSGQIGQYLDEFDPEVVVCYGYSQKLQRHAIRWAKSHHKKLLMIADSELRQQRHPVKAMIKKVMLPRSLAGVDAFLTVGDANEAYYRNYGVPDTRFVRSFFPIDIDSFDQRYASRESIRASVRSRHGIPDSHLVVLMVGKLMTIKRQIDLVDAAIMLRAAGIGVSVLLAGTGAEEHAIRARVSQAGFKDAVLLGFVDPDQLVDYYLASDVYVHCSSAEPHSLAISEAIYAGLPVVLSDRCGSYGPSDDVRVGLNGFVYPCGKVSALAGELAKLARSPGLRHAMGVESRSIGVAAQALAHGKALLQALELIRT